MGGAVRPRQISLRAHLDQARGGALELLRLITFVAAIERVGLRLGRGDQLHVHVVEGVDQDDEALGGIAVVESHHRHAVENDGVVFVRDAQIVGGGKRLLAQIVEGKTRDTHGGARHVHACALDGKLLRLAVVPGASRRQASSSAASAAASAGTYHTGMPASFSSRKSVRASSRTISMCCSSMRMNGTNNARFKPSL